MRLTASIQIRGTKATNFDMANKDERVRQLLQRGKARGYILYDEIDEFLPAGCGGGPELDDVLSELARNSIEVVEEPSAERDAELNAKHKALDETGFLEELDQESGEDAALRMYVREVLTIPRLTREQEIDFAKRIRGGGQDAEHAERQLIEANLGLVVATAKRYRHLGRSAIDLVQEGNIGLMKAVQNFNYERGYKFSTYATWWVRQTIMRGG